MHIHILGVCGTFMGSLAILARQLGHKVTGSDANVYPPMSTQLEEQGIELIEGFDPAQLDLGADQIVVGNAMSRGNPVIEAMLDRGMDYISGPQWLSQHLLKDRWVLAVAGTHGKTSTSTMLAWILEQAGMSPGYLIGGIPGNFGISARLGESDFFVIEADEYDTAFFDKRSKFVHYHPRTLVLNNLEFDHADIFDDLAAIQRQFHHLLRILPANGRAILPANDEPLQEVVEQGLWSELEKTSLEPSKSDWSVADASDEGSRFTVVHQGQAVGSVIWSQTGQHNIANALSAIAAARHVGVKPALACEALGRFEGVKRRMELLAEVDGISIYDDFAHHPTAIATTLAGLRAKVGQQRIIAIIEPRSNTMRMGNHHHRLAGASAQADRVIWYQPKGMDWSLQDVVKQSATPAQWMNDTQTIIDNVVSDTAAGDHIVIMSNGGFEGIHQRLIAALQVNKN